MRFWIKIGILAVAAYVACNVCSLLRDRREHHAVMRDVEAVTRSVVDIDMSHGASSEAQMRLRRAKSELDSAEAQWRHDARNLLLLSSAD